MDKPLHLIGTFGENTITSDGIGGGRQVRRVGQVVPTWEGLVRHAIPEGTSTSLCGRDDLRSWPSAFPGQIGSSRDICEECRERWDALG